MISLRNFLIFLGKHNFAFKIIPAVSLSYLVIFSFRLSSRMVPSEWLCQSNRLAYNYTLRPIQQSIGKLCRETAPWIRLSIHLSVLKNYEETKWFPVSERKWWDSHLNIETYWSFLIFTPFCYKFKSNSIIWWKMLEPSGGSINAFSFIRWTMCRRWEWDSRVRMANAWEWVNKRIQVFRWEMFKNSNMDFGWDTHTHTDTITHTSTQLHSTGQIESNRRENEKKILYFQLFFLQPTEWTG